jgi:hypothetical protein
LDADRRANNGDGSWHRELQFNRGVGEFEGFEVRYVPLMKQRFEYPK